jgi:hypothetical protein
MFGEDFDNSWQTTSIAASTIANGSSAVISAPISLDGKTAVLLGIVIAYGATVNKGAEVFQLCDVNGTYESRATDAPYGFELPRAASTTIRRARKLPAVAADVKYEINNNTGAQITATLVYKLVQGVTS